MEHTTYHLLNHDLSVHDLPEEVLFDIFSNLPDPVNLAKSRIVCRKWNQIASDNRLWMFHFRKTFRTQESYLQQQFKLDNVGANDNSNNIDDLNQDTRIDWLQAFNHRIIIDTNIKKQRYRIHSIKSPFLKGVEPFHYNTSTHTLITGDTAGRLKVFKSTEKGFELKHNLKTHTGIIWWVDATDEICIAGGVDGSVPLIDINKGETKKTFVMPSGAVWGLGYSAKDDLVVAGGDRGHLVSFSVATGAVTTSNINSPIYDLCIVGQDLVAVAAVAVGFLGVWNISTNRLEYTLLGHTDTVLCLLYKDGVLLSADYDGNLFVWDLTTKQSIRQLQAGGQAWSLGLLENVLAAGVMGTSDSFIRLWNYDTSEMLYDITISVSSNLGRITCLYMMPNGIVCSCGELWHVDFRNKDDETGGKYNPFLLEW